MTPGFDGIPHFDAQFSSENQRLGVRLERLPAQAASHIAVLPDVVHAVFMPHLHAHSFVVPI